MEQAKQTDKSLEVEQLRTELSNIHERYKEKIKRIDEIKTKLKTGYRHHDKDKYVKEREQIAEDLFQLDNETKEIEKKINILGG